MNGMICQSSFLKSFLVALRSYATASLISTTDALSEVSVGSNPFSFIDGFMIARLPQLGVTVEAILPQFKGKDVEEPGRGERRTLSGGLLKIGKGIARI